ncbi:MAG: hypothetical protein ACI308_08215 [Muribaculaceae bacterium]
MNKSAITLLAAISLTANLHAGNTLETDSINITNAKSVTIVERDGKVTLQIDGTEGNPDYTYIRTINNDGITVVKEENRRLGFKIPFVDRDTDSRDIVKSHRSHFDFCMNIGGFGWVTTTQKPSDFRNLMKHSVEFCFDHLINVKFYPQGDNRTHFMLGFGMQWRNIALDNQRWMRDPETRQIAYGPWDDSYYDRSSRLHTYSLTVPLMLIQPIGRDFSLSVGAKACFNVCASAICDYRNDDIHYNESFSHLNQRPVTAELCAAINLWNTIGLYANYAPCRMFKDGKGPELKTFSIGVAICY